MHVIPPGSTIGILGGGQLGRMLAMAAAEMGYKTHIFCPEADAPAAEKATHHTVAEYTDEAALQAFAASVDVITYEFENIPASCPRFLAGLKPVYPSPDALEICQHRVREKELAQSLGIGTAPFAPVSTNEELQVAIKKIGLPAVLKTCRMGYDGKGQWKFKSGEEARLPEIPAQGKDDMEFILEGFIDFTMEISVIVARNAAGETATYVPVQNIHRDHILHQTIVPAPVPAALAVEAETIAKKLADALKLVGLLAVEMFVTKEGRVLVNEMAPRPHNSGHWTIDAAAISQFTQCIRAICGLTLGDTTRTHDAVMTNLIGDEITQAETYARQPGARVHLYGKKEARKGRKMGHVTQLITNIN